MRNSTQDISAVGPGMAEPVDRFRLNNLSFAGPVVMGVGGKQEEKKSIHYHQSLGAVISVNGEESYLLMLQVQVAFYEKRPHFYEHRNRMSTAHNSCV